MGSKEFKKIRLEYEEKMASLNAEQDLAVKTEHARLKTLADREKELKKQTIEANLAINAILKGDNTSSNTSSCCSDSDGESNEESTSETPLIAEEGILNSGCKRKEPPPAIIKQLQAVDGPNLPKSKKMLIKSPKRRPQTATVDRSQTTKNDSDILRLLNIIKRDNIEIMRRLEIVEDKLSTAAPTADKAAETSHKGAFLAMKCDWVPKIMRYLSLIYEEVRTTDEEK